MCIVAVNNMFTGCMLLVYCMYNVLAMNAYWVYRILDVKEMYSGCILGAYLMYIESILYLYWVHIGCMLINILNVCWSYIGCIVCVCWVHIWNIY